MTEHDEYLRYLTLRGVQERYGFEPLPDGEWEKVEHYAEGWEIEVQRRVEHELGVIAQAGFASYFLIVADILRFAREQGIPVGPGRGSVCGSAVAYCLYITDVEPIRFGIPFERFLHLERVAQPDIDIDLCQRRRGEVIDYIRERYRHVAQIAAFGTMMAKGVVRDVCRVLHAPMGAGDDLSAMIPEGSGADQVSLREFIESEEGAAFKEAITSTQAESGDDILDHCLRLEGLRRHGSSHAAGVVIADRDLSEVVPLWRRNKDAELHTQYDYKDSEDVGLLKMDVLGLRTVTVLGDAEAMIRAHDPEFSIKDVPLDDEATYRLISAGDTVGIFQLEGEGITNAVRGLRPDRFEDITAILALYRPGPMEQLGSYVDRKHGREPVDYPLDELEPILSSTYGLIVYQEQVMGIARALAGYTPGEADLFRKAIGKKLPELIREEIAKFSERAVENGYDEDIVNELGEQIAYFGRYGFNLGHATGYAYITYWTAYLKANHPTEFYVALLNSHVSEADRVGAILIDAKKHGVAVLSPDINESGRWFRSVEAGVIRFGLEAVKGLGDKVATDILEERDSYEKNAYVRVKKMREKKDGTRYQGTMVEAQRVPNEPREYHSLWDFCARLPGVPINVKQALVVAGAFTQDLEERALMLAALPELNTAAKAGRLYNWRKWNGPVASRLELAKMERDVLGFYVTEHPLDSHRRILERYGAVIDGSYDRLGKNVCVAGLLAEVKTHQSKRGEMAWLTLESGIQDLPRVTVFSDQWQPIRRTEKGAVVIVWGKKESHPKFGPSIIASDVHVMERHRVKAGSVVITLPETDIGDLVELHDQTEARGATIYLVVGDGNGHTALVRTDRRINPTRDILNEIEARGGGIRYDPPRTAPLPWGSGQVRRRANPDLAVAGRGHEIWTVPVVRSALSIFGGAVVSEMEEV